MNVQRVGRIRLAATVVIAAICGFGLVRGRGDARAQLRPDDFCVVSVPYLIEPRTVLTLTIEGVGGPGRELVYSRVPRGGAITLPELNGPIRVVGLTEFEVQPRVAAGYRAAGHAEAVVTLTILEGPSPSFTVHGDVGTPGKHRLSRADHRLPDALRHVGAEGDGEVMILRRRWDEDHKATGARLIQLPLRAVLESPADYNIVVRPGDVIVVRALR